MTELEDHGKFYKRWPMEFLSVDSFLHLDFACDGRKMENDKLRVFVVTLALMQICWGQ